MRLPPAFADLLIFLPYLAPKLFQCYGQMPLEFQNDSKKLGFNFFGM